MNRDKVLNAQVPYIEVFGEDGMGRGRPSVESKAFALTPVLDMPSSDLIPDRVVARKIRDQARSRALATLRVMFAREFMRLYRKEMNHLVSKHSVVAGDGSTRVPGKFRPIRKVEVDA